MNILQALKNAQRAGSAAFHQSEATGPQNSQGDTQASLAPNPKFVQTLGALEQGAQFLPAAPPPSRDYAQHWFWGDWKDAGRVGKFGQELRATAPRAIKAAVSQAEIEALGGAQGQEAIKQEAREILAAEHKTSLLRKSLDNL